jgi:hypothetical protein
MTARLSALALACTLCGLVEAQDWAQRHPSSSPAGRYQHALAYDEQRGRTLLFGGFIATGPSAETWQWDGANWTPRITWAYPPARASHAMAYDSRRGRVVMFGGQDGQGGLFGDTWEWDGSNWIQQTSASAPSPRYQHAMAYDAARGRVVLFGGHETGTNNLLGDTWEWDGSNWQQLYPTSSPSARHVHAMAYDARRCRTVLFGGGPGFPNETWEWDGASWLQIATTLSPSARSVPSMAYDADLQRVVLFGGLQNGTSVRLDDTWEWDGVQWVQNVTAMAPPGGHSRGMAFDTRRGQMVVFGGWDHSSAYFTDTWERAFPASVRSFGTGCGQLALDCAPAAGSLPVLGSTQLTEVRNIPASSAFMAIGLSNVALGPFALPLPLDGFGLNGCSLYHDLVLPFESCTPTGTATAQYAVHIPNDPALVKFQLFLQAWAPAPAANSGGLVFSNALELTLGR